MTELRIVVRIEREFVCDWEALCERWAPERIHDGSDATFLRTSFVELTDGGYNGGRDFQLLRDEMEFEYPDTPSES